MEDGQSSDRFVASFSWYSMIPWLLFTVAASGAALIEPLPYFTGVLAPLLSIAILAVGGGAIALVARQRTGPQVVIDREGIYAAHPLSVRDRPVRCAWSSITRLESWRQPRDSDSYRPRRWLTVYLSDGRRFDIGFSFIRPGLDAALAYLEKIGRPARSRHEWSMLEMMTHIRVAEKPPYPGDDG